MLNVILTLKYNVIRYSTSSSKVKYPFEEILRCFYSILESYLHLRLNWDIASQVGHKLSAAVCRLGICELSEIYPFGASYPISYPNMRYRV